MDVSGSAAMLNSLLTAPSNHHASTVQNMKFSRELYQRNPEKIRALLDGCFAAGARRR